ncbi:hypothetical protein J0A68_15275 [Algoriphagus sp. H41]|uniref:Virulence plasmid A protein n=1 Tax=Algoriphagus oliviformis TaxID=2811231 RepID=A0ABS3C5N0_9BACT|nr:hypothetical protein [Algoriphagus oliviformis]MBN7812313.1 hypothetical protein [Algoriphagus oliviformis]
MATFLEQIKKIKQLRETYSSAEKSSYSDKLEMASKAKKGTSVTMSSASKQKELLFRQTEVSLNAAITGLLAVNHRTLTRELSGDLPIVMLPVRIETRFVTPVGAAQELWVRIFPDDIHADTHEPLLAEKEVEAGEEYWAKRAGLHSFPPGEEAESKKKLAWENLKAVSISPQRAIWIAKATRPLNWPKTDSPPPANLDFPKHTQFKESSWTRAARTQALPDRFVLTIFAHGKAVHEQVGAVIPDTVFLGPDPLATEQPFAKKEDEIVFQEEIAWLQSFDKAVAKGLGMKVKLSPAMRVADGSIERITVLGLLHSADPESGKKLVEDLFENHHYSSKGLSFLPQGTPTNNTETGASGYSRNEDNLSKGYYEEQAVPANPQSDLDLFAQGFGINREVLKDLSHAAQMDHFDNLMMNRALYAATLAYYFEELMEPAIKEADAVQIRSFFTSFVTARGPLSAIRVGDQPYGVLLTSDLSRWNEAASGKFFIGLAEVLKRLQSVWDQLSAKVPRVGMPGDSWEILLKILGLQPGSVAFRQRLGNLPDYSLASPLVNQSFFNVEIKNLNQRIVEFLTTLGFNPLAKGNFYPLISNMVFYQWTNPIGADKLILPDVAASDAEFLPKLPKSGLNYAEYMGTRCTLAEIETVNFGGDKPPRSLLALLMRHALLSELKQAGTKAYQANNQVIKSAMFEKSFFNMDKNNQDLTSFELLKGDPKKINSNAFANVNTSLGDHLLNPRIRLPWNPNIAPMRAAMNYLGGLSTKALERNLADFVDLCSYRLDAWQMGLFTRRLQQNRAKAPTGVYLASYGWVENLRPEPKKVLNQRTVPKELWPKDGTPPIKLKQNAGFSHVPSLNHATAVGLLLAGYKNHASPSNPSLFAMNLSSDRARRAMALFEGIRNGQRLEVLLGYEFERGLHDATTSNPAHNLNRYIQAFRSKYEIENLSIPQQGATEAQETIDSYPVVNGLKILKASDAEVSSLVTVAAHRPLVLALKAQLANTLDACNDLLVTEAAFQITQGNRDRTSGVLNSALMADTPPEIQVLDTPRSSLLTYTHRIAAHLDVKKFSPPGKGWPADPSPRAAFEPGLNRWVAELIGDPRKIMCRVTSIPETGARSKTELVSLDDLGLQPIDLVYLLSEDLSAGATELESRIASYFRKSKRLEASVRLQIEFSPELRASAISLASAFPLLRSIKMSLGQSRVADARDFASRAKSVVNSLELTGVDFEDYRQRIEEGLGSLRSMVEAFGAMVPGPSLPKDETNPPSMSALFGLAEASVEPSQLYQAVDLSPETLSGIREFQESASLFGVQLAYPQSLGPEVGESQEDLLSRVGNLWKVVNAKIELGAERLAKAATETEVIPRLKSLSEAAKALLGEDFLPIPRFLYSNEDVMKKTLKDEKQLLKYINGKTGLSGEVNKESWLQSVARVRPAVARFETLRFMSEALGNEAMDLSLAQVPFRPDDSWLGFEFPKEYAGKPFNIMEDTVSLACLGAQAAQTKDLQSVLILDEWTEKIPVEEEITGLAYHYNQPNATAPQAVLLAVEPTQSGKWDWDVLQGVLNDTIRRSRSRAVEPDQLMEHDVLKILLPMTIASYDVKEANVSLDYLTLNDKFMQLVKSTNMQLYTKWEKN